MFCDSLDDWISQRQIAAGISRSLLFSSSGVRCPDVPMTCFRIQLDQQAYQFGCEREAKDRWFPILGQNLQKLLPSGSVRAHALSNAVS
jgi:hypothetical protein